ncbi:MAG TPA: hypothetical protein VJ779_09060 [Acetobacteraceae bacterium]|nr:hypothetical protein [Acetobacteraceae bacterium]
MDRLLERQRGGVGAAPVLGAQRADELDARRSRRKQFRHVGQEWAQGEIAANMLPTSQRRNGPETNFLRFL